MLAEGGPVLRAVLKAGVCRREALCGEAGARAVQCRREEDQVRREP